MMQSLIGSLLNRYKSEFNHNIVIDASGVALDGVGGILGSAGPTGITQLPDSTFVYANKGRMRFDTADLASLESRGTLFDVIVHEMAHVIGFGTLWTTDFFIAGSQSNYVSGSGRYTGEYALEIYRREFVENATFIPVELGSRHCQQSLERTLAWWFIRPTGYLGYIQFR